MLRYDILVPTCKSPAQLASFIEELGRVSSLSANIIVSGFNACASVNRNYCLGMSTAEAVVMLDDDISGLPHNWDVQLIHALEEIPNAVMVSARLMNEDGTVGVMMDIKPDMSTQRQVVESGYLPSACIAFRRYKDAWFDENFVGSGWEDTDFCDTLHKINPAGVFAICNDVQVVHRNEMKNGSAVNFEINKQYYCKKHRRVGV